MSSGGHGAYPQQTTKEIGLDRGLWVSMRNLRFGFFENSGLPVESRILIFYSFETEDRLARSGILHYLIPERRFVGPRHAAELTTAALEFLDQAVVVLGPESRLTVPHEVERAHPEYVPEPATAPEGRLPVRPASLRRR